MLIEPKRLESTFANRALGPRAYLEPGVTAGFDIELNKNKV
jgi:hypothetical protein